MTKNVYMIVLTKSKFPALFYYFEFLIVILIFDFTIMTVQTPVLEKKMMDRVSSRSAEGAATVALGRPASNVMERLFESAPDNFPLPKVGDIVEGRVIKKSARNLYIDLSRLGTGIVYGREFIEAQDMIKGLKPGDTVFTKITDFNNENNFIELSLMAAQSQKTWDILKGLQRNAEIISTKILDANRGGLIVEVQGVQGFLPVSQLNAEHYPRVEGGDKNKILGELQKFIGQSFSVRILDLDPKENKLIVSEKAAVKEELKKAISSYKIGDTVDGEISGIVDWGVFIKWSAPSSENLEGLVHISELDWQLIENPADFVKVGDKIKAQIIDIILDRISLSIKRLKPDPWKLASTYFEKDAVYEGAVTKFNPFGAFVELPCREGNPIQGLCHISEFGSDEIMKSAIELGKKYKFKLLSFEPNERRMSLSLIKKENKA